LTSWSPGHYSTATQVTAVVVCPYRVPADIVPYAFLELRPEATKAFLKNAQNWLTGHVQELISYVCLILGAYLAISAVVRLASPHSTSAAVTMRPPISSP